jgi:AraC-like DNA-binding protein
LLTSKVHTIIRILSLSGLLALFGCAREVVTPARIPQASDSLYTAKNRALVRMINELNDTRFDISRRSLNGLLSAYANGQSFTAYVNNLRLEDAVHQLQDRPDRSISEIAESVGFTPANFREQFKRQYGMTPTEYKNNL